MPIHDWTRVDAGLFHNFHQQWTIALCNALNEGVLPADYFALVDQNIRGPIPDVLTLELAGGDGGSAEDGNGRGGLAVATTPPRTQLIRRSEAEIYADRANIIAVRHHRHGKVVAVAEIVSPGNKGSKAEFRAVITKASDPIQEGIHLLVIDLFPPGKRDPQGVHKAIWDEFVEEDLELPPGKPLTLVSYDAGPERIAYVNFVAVGDDLPEMPLFFRPGNYVQAPLETTYPTAWTHFPARLKGLLETRK